MGCMVKYKNFLTFVLIINFLVLITSPFVLKAYAEQKSYRRIFPESVSPLPDDIERRDSRLEMEADVAKEGKLLESEQKQPASSTGGITIGGGGPSQLYYKIAVNDKLYIAVWRV